MDKLHHELWIVKVVNDLFGPAVAALLRPFGFTFPAGQDVIPDYLVMCAVILVMLSALGLFLRSRLSVENPGTLQVALEEVVGLFMTMLRNNIG